MIKTCLALGVVAALLAHDVGRAQGGLLTVNVTSGATQLIVVDGSADDADINPNSVNIKSSALLGAFGAYLLSGSAVSASSNFATSLHDEFSNLTTQYTLKARTGLNRDFLVTANQTGFMVPGNTKQLDISASFTFTNSGNNSAGSFQGSVGTTNGASNVYDTLITAQSTGNTPNSNSGSGDGVQFTSGNATLSMQNVLMAHFVTGKKGVIQGQGTSLVTFVSGPGIDTVDSVPEPTSIAIFGTLLGAVFVAYRRRRLPGATEPQL